MKKISTEIDTKGNIRTHVVVGSITVRELMESLSKIYSSTLFDSNMNSLWDLREADFSSFTQSDINLVKNMVDRHWGRKGRSRSALVMGQLEALRMTQFYEIILDATTNKKVRRFQDYSEALDWLMTEPPDKAP